MTYGDFASRGVATWLDASAPADAPCRRRIFVATAQSQLFAIEPATAPYARDSAATDQSNLKAGLRIPPFEPQAYSMTSPPVVVNGVGRDRFLDRRQQPPELPSGEVRGFDARTGALKWTWDPIPQDPRIRRTANGAAGWRRRAAPRTPGRSWRPIPSATWCSCRPAARRPTITARCGSATTATRIPSSR